MLLTVLIPLWGNIILLLSPLPQTVVLYFLQSLACCLAVSHFKPMVLSSPTVLHPQVCCVRPLLLFPCGYQSSACRFNQHQRHFLLLIFTCMGSWLVPCPQVCISPYQTISDGLIFLNLLLVEMAVDFHTGRKMANAVWSLTFHILALMSSSVPPDWLILLLRQTSSLMSSNRC